MPLNICRVGVRRTGPDSLQWWPATGQGAMGTNWSMGSSVWTWGRTSSLWGWQSTGTGCPGRWWSLLLWRYSRPTWTRSCAACCRWPCFGRGVGLDDPQRSLATPNILWFCEYIYSARKPAVTMLSARRQHHDYTVNASVSWHVVSLNYLCNIFTGQFRSIPFHSNRDFLRVNLCFCYMRNIIKGQHQKSCFTCEVTCSIVSLHLTVCINSSDWHSGLTILRCLNLE